MDIKWLIILYVAGCLLAILLLGVKNYQNKAELNPIVDFLFATIFPIYLTYISIMYFKNKHDKRNSIVKEIDNFRHTVSGARSNYNRWHFENLLEANRIVEGWRNNEISHVSQDCINSDSNLCEDKHENTINSIIDSRENIKSLLLKLQKEN